MGSVPRIIISDESRGKDRLDNNANFLAALVLAGARPLLFRIAPHVRAGLLVRQHFPAHRSDDFVVDAIVIIYANPFSTKDTRCGPILLRRLVPEIEKAGVLSAIDPVGRSSRARERDENSTDAYQHSNK